MLMSCLIAPCIRFVDSQFSYQPEQIRLLLRVLRADTPQDRRRWFHEVCGCRRRPQVSLVKCRTSDDTSDDASDGTSDDLLMTSDGC